jgi:uncharacterized membrane protein YhhN
MTTLAWTLLSLTGLLAVADWIAVARGRKRAEYVFKPATLVALITVALALDPTVEAQRWLVVGALVFSLAGDVFLMLPRDRFIAGLSSFLTAHLLYVAGFAVAGLTAAAVGVGVVIAGVLGVSLAVAILSSVNDPRLRVAVTAYMVVIFAMLVTAIGTANPVAATGAVLFVASDAVLGWNRFVGGLPWARVFIMVTYHVGQALIVLSLAW